MVDVLTFIEVVYYQAGIGSTGYLNCPAIYVRPVCSLGTWHTPLREQGGLSIDMSLLYLFLSSALRPKVVMLMSTTS